MTSSPALPIVVAPSIAILGSKARFPFRRIFCVGQNYADHAREMGSDPDRQEPFFFTKPADAIVPSGADLAFPSRTKDLHHEVELVIALGQGGSNIAVADASACIYGHAVGLDLTRRDLQAATKKAGRPWDMARGSISPRRSAYSCWDSHPQRAPSTSLSMVHRDRPAICRR